MKLLCIYSPSHACLAQRWFLPSVRHEYDVDVRNCPEPDGASRGTFLEADWQEAVQFKSKQILGVIERHPGECFVYSDVDVRFYGPTLPAVWRALDGCDIVCHLDDPGGNLCTGFMAMRANAVTHLLWTRVLAALPKMRRDQIEFNRLLRVMTELRWGYLPEGFFGTGTFKARHWEPGTHFHVPENPLVFHANWTVGVERKMALLQTTDELIQGGRTAIRRNNQSLSQEPALGPEIRAARRRLKRGSRPLKRFWETLQKPAMVRLDASTACQLKCPSCPTAGGEVGKSLGTGLLRAEAFRAFVKRHPWVSQIELSNWGEIFLNPELPDILKHACQNGIRICIQNGANLNKAAPEALESLVRYKVRHLSCSIDGASQETYAVYRVGGDFERVIGHIRALNALKRKYRSPYPALRWQFVAFGHNEHEIEQARVMAGELNMEFFLKLSWEDLYGRPFSPVRDREQIRSQGGLGASDRAEYEEKHKKNYIQKACHQMWNSPQINYDGRLLGCCLNHGSDYGNVFQGGLERALAGEKMTRAREMLLGLRNAEDDIPCSNCPVYLSRLARHDWVSAHELQAEKVSGRLAHWIEDHVGIRRRHGN
ncbi:MAG: putative nucleotide-diphospho-sugar transferase [Methylacidiphilales bacterium]|nr:putative nucleotide-diphospho-sugar transferase [Candidatus Methylacidiphilales bacterium]